MTRTSMLSWALVLASSLALAGCAAEQAQPVPGTHPPVARRAPEPPPKPPERAPTPSRKVTLPAAPAGYAVLNMAQPTGAMADSVVHISKAAPKEVVVGRPFDYRITVTNLTKVAVENVLLTAKLPANFKPTRSTPETEIADQKAIWQVGRLGPEASKTFVVYGAATRTGSLTYCSEVVYRLSQDCLAIRAVQPALKLAMSGPDEVLLCDVITYTIVASNPGTGEARNVKVTAALPDGMKTVDGKTAVVFDAGTLAPGQSREFAVRAKPAKAGKHVSKTTAAAEGDLSAEDSAETVVRQPMLALDLTGPKTRFVGRPATYTIALANKGDGAARNTVLTQTLPAGVEFVDASDGGKASGGKVTWRLGTMAADASRKVTTTVRTSSVGMVRSAAMASADCAEASGAAAMVVKGIPAILLECVDLADPIEVGAKETYVITVTNQGSAVGTNIVVTCVLAAEQEFVSATAPVKETAVGKTVTFAPLRSLDPKAKATYRVVVKGTKAGDVRFKVSLKSDQMTSPAEETESTHIYE